MIRIVLTTLTILVILVSAASSIADAKTPRGLPPAWRTWLEVCSREQPKPGVYDPTKWSTPNWTHNGAGVDYPGACGMTRQNYSDIRRKGWPATMDLLSPRLQLWACHFLFWKYARIGQKMLGSYEAGQRYGATVWEVHTQMGWHGFKRDGKTWQ